MSPILSPTKRCTKCDTKHPATLEYFRADKHHRDGLRSHCRACDREYQRQRHATNPEYKRQYQRTHRKEAREYRRRWDKANPGYQLRYQLQWCSSEANREKMREKSRKWERANPEKSRAKSARRKARKFNASGSYTAEDVRIQVCAQTDSKGRLICWWCDKPIKGKYHVDHRIPLNKGGLNSARNICVAHEKCNLSKSDKLPHEFNGRLL